MYKKLLLLICVALVPMLSWADTQGEKALVELSQRLRDLGAYESAITLKSGSDVVEGHYRISGKDYYINIGNVEFWGDGDKRYEVSHKIEEVVVERVKQNDNTLLGNPTQAFDLAEKGFDATISAQGAESILRLMPKENETSQIDVDQVVIHLDSKTLLPTKIVYKADGQSVEVQLHGIKKSKSSLAKFDISNYRKYDIVDLY